MNNNEVFDFNDAAIIIKDAIVRSRYQAAALVNKELLGLYYAVGRYVSMNSRSSVWGQGAIRRLSESLQRELPGLRGFSEVSIKRMRLFYEGWQPIFLNRPLPMGDLTLTTNLESRHAENKLAVAVQLHSGEIAIDLNLLSRHLNGFAASGFSHDFSIDAFLRVGFTQHSEILAKEKSLEGRLFYITRCAAEFWSVEALKSNLRGDLYAKSGALPNNFLQTLPEREQARRAELVAIVAAIKQSLRDGKAHTAVVGKPAAVCEKLKFLCFYIVPLKTRADNIANYCANHNQVPY